MDDRAPLEGVSSSAQSSAGSASHSSQVLLLGTGAVSKAAVAACATPAKAPSVLLPSRKRAPASAPQGPPKRVAFGQSGGHPAVESESARHEGHDDIEKSRKPQMSAPPPPLQLVKSEPQPQPPPAPPCQPVESVVQTVEQKPESAQQAQLPPPFQRRRLGRRMVRLLWTRQSLISHMMTPLTRSLPVAGQQVQRLRLQRHHIIHMHRLQHSSRSTRTAECTHARLSEFRVFR